MSRNASRNIKENRRLLMAGARWYCSPPVSSAGIATIPFFVAAIPPITGGANEAGADRFGVGNVRLISEDRA